MPGAGAPTRSPHTQNVSGRDSASNQTFLTPFFSLPGATCPCPSDPAAVCPQVSSKRSAGQGEGQGCQARASGSGARSEKRTGGCGCPYLTPLRDVAPGGAAERFADEALTETLDVEVRACPV